MDKIKTDIRKLRKKLRQIDALEHHDRDLTDEEIEKVLKKPTIRTELYGLLSQVEADYDAPSNVGDVSQQSVVSDNEEMLAANVTNESSTRTTGHQKDEYESISHTSTTPSRPSPPPPLSSSSFADNTPVNIPAENIKKKRKSVEKIRSVSQSDSEFVQPQTVVTHVEPPKKSKTEDKKPKHTARQEDKHAKLRNTWRKTEFRVRNLEGHNDLVEAVHADGNLLISGSRDTTVKVWDTEICAETKSLGGHTGTVTCVLILSEEESARLAEVYELSGTPRLALSGSKDCSVKLWDLDTGTQLRSVYIYSSVVSMGYMYCEKVLVTGSEGGKIELWNLETGANVVSLRSDDGAISCLQVEGKAIYSGSEEGTIRVYEYKDSQLHLQFESENLQSPPGQIIYISSVRSLVARDNIIYYGDDGINVKVMNWKTGFVNKLRNHTYDFGVTDSLSFQNNLVISSGYDIDHGLGYLNVRLHEDHEYLGTVSDGSTGRMFCLATTKTRNGMYRWITGGMELKVWEQLTATRSSGDEDVITVSVNSKFTVPPTNSDNDDMSESDLGDSDVEVTQRRSRHQTPDTDTQKSWCSIA